MQIKKSGFIFRMAYGDPDHYIHSFETNWCQIIRNIISNLFINIIFGIIKVVAYALVFIIEGIVFFFGFWFARRPAVFKGEEEDFKKRLTMRYKRWPTISGWRIYPIWLIVAALAYENRVDIIRSAFQIAVSAAQHTVFSSNFWIGVAVLLVLIFLACLAIKFSQSEAFMVFKEYLKARKEKVCPMVKIVE